MTNDSDKFRTEAEPVAAGAYRVAPNRWKKGAEEWVPLYEGKMVQAFDHRAASVVVDPANINRPAQPEPATDERHGDPNRLPNPQFWISADFTSGIRQAWTIGPKHVSSATNARTVICAIVPRAGCGNSLPVLDCENGGQSFERWAPLLLANLDSFALDFIARQKRHGNNLNLYVIEQLPILPLDAYARTIGTTTAEAIIRDHVLRLSNGAHDPKPFAEDGGYDGPPFRWDPEERLHLRARLDALFFLLYGLDRDPADHILGTFPVVREEELERYGCFRSRDLVLGYMAAFATGDAESRIPA